MIVVSLKTGMFGGNSGGVGGVLKDIAKKDAECFFLSLGKTSGHKRSASEIGVGKDWDNYYLGASNQMLWPFFHQVGVEPVWKKKWWAAYQLVNLKLTEVALNLSRRWGGDRLTFFVNDYQNMLVPQFLRERLPSSYIVYFHHVPWLRSGYNRRSVNSFIVKSLVESLIHCDVVAFQTPQDCQSFVNTCEKFLPLVTNIESCSNEWTLTSGKRVVVLRSVPVGISTKRFTAVNKAINNTKTKTVTKFLGVDRLDYIKGLDNKIDFFGEFLSKHKRYIGKVTLTQIITPTSRIRIKEYSNLLESVLLSSEKINKELGENGWQPVRIIHDSFSLESMSQIYQSADVGIVSSYADGQNLVSKEMLYANRQRPFNLLLSNKCGSYFQLKNASYSFDPRSKHDFFNAVQTCMTSPISDSDHRDVIHDIETKDVGWWFDKVTK